MKILDKTTKQLQNIKNNLELEKARNKKFNQDINAQTEQMASFKEKIMEKISHI